MNVFHAAFPNDPDAQEEALALADDLIDTATAEPGPAVEERRPTLPDGDPPVMNFQDGDVTEVEG